MTAYSGIFADSDNGAGSSTRTAANAISARTLEVLETWEEKSISDQLHRTHYGPVTSSTKAEETGARPSLDPFANEPSNATKLELPPRLEGAVRQSSPHLNPLQEWEGYVLEVGANSFTVRLLDLTAGSSIEEEEAEVPIEEISEQERRRIQPGAIFRWVIGYERSPAGVRKRVSVIVFRDLPAVTERDLQEGREWASETRHLLGL